MLTKKNKKIAKKGSFVKANEKTYFIIKYGGISINKAYEIINSIHGNGKDDYWYVIENDNREQKRFHYLFFDLIDTIKNNEKKEVCKICNGKGKIKLFYSVSNCECRLFV